MFPGLTRSQAEFQFDVGGVSSHVAFQPRAVDGAVDAFLGFFGLSQREYELFAGQRAKLESDAIFLFGEYDRHAVPFQTPGRTDRDSPDFRMAG